MSEAIEKAEPKAMEYVPYGCQDKIKLSISIVKNLIAVPTKSGKTCSDKEAMKFLMLCQSKRLNPFEGDCFLIGYDGRDGVAQFSLITAHQAFLKRAELHPEFDGMKSGIIVQGEEGKLVELEGDFHVEDQKVVGGWATVYFKNRKIPMTRRLRLKRFQKPFGVWLDDPAGMIVKCAESDALRSSFPTMLGGLYLREEVELPTNGGQGAHDTTGAAGALPAQVTSAAASTTATEAKSELGSIAAPGASEYPHVKLAEYVTSEKFTFEQFRTWGIQTGNLDESVQSFEEVPANVAVRLLRAKAGLLKGLQAVREGESNE